MGSVSMEDRLRTINRSMSEEKWDVEEGRPSSSQSQLGMSRKVQFTTRPTIVFDSASKSYRKTPVLKKLNITVKEGTIYAIYGKSGCGKSTALSCLLKTEKLDSGRIYIRGESKGFGIPGKRIGFMPQTLSLNMDFTMKESLHYYGKIYGMSVDDVEEKRKSLSQILDLEGAHEQILQMCDDRRRLVSFMVAILHKPEIIIMDEPTICMDPASRDRIWQHVSDLVAESRATVIFTTSSIHEARKANMIGFLRHGRILIEETASNLRSKFSTNSLEEAVLKLCQQDDKDTKTSQSAWNSIKISSVKEKEGGRVSTTGKSIGSLVRQSSWHVGKRDLTRSPDRLQALFFKNLLLTYRNIWLVLFLLILPSATIYFGSMSLTFLPKDLKLGIVRNASALSDIEDSGSTGDDCWSTSSCELLKKLRNKSLSLVNFSDEEEALEEVLSGRLWGYLNFVDGNADLGSNTTDQGDVADGVGRPVVRISMDATNPFVVSWLKSILYSSLYAIEQSKISDFHSQEASDDNALQIDLFESPIFGGTDEGSNLSNFLVPGLTLHILTFYSAIISALIFMHEKNRGIFTRLLTAGVLYFEIIVSHFTFLLLLLLSQASLSFLLIFCYFNVPQIGSSLLAYVLVITHAYSGLALGVASAAICKKEQYAVLLILFTSAPTLFLSSTISPIEGLPKALKYFGLIYPGTLPGMGLKQILLRGWGLSHFGILLSFASSIGSSALYLLITCIYYLINRC